jgi:hypothetical protein
MILLVTAFQPRLCLSVTVASGTFLVSSFSEDRALGPSWKAVRRVRVSLGRSLRKREGKMVPLKFL